MRVTCIANRGSSLSEERFAIGYTKETVFTISLNKGYEVFAMSLCRGAIMFLLADDFHLPNWFPAELFRIDDPALPQDWMCSIAQGGDGNLQALLGYGRLITDADHYDALLERDPDTLRRFYDEERKRQTAGDDC